MYWKFSITAFQPEFGGHYFMEDCWYATYGTALWSVMLKFLWMLHINFCTYSILTEGTSMATTLQFRITSVTAADIVDVITYMLSHFNLKDSAAEAASSYLRLLDHRRFYCCCCNWCCISCIILFYWRPCWNYRWCLLRLWSCFSVIQSLFLLFLLLLVLCSTVVASILDSLTAIWCCNEFAMLLRAPELLLAFLLLRQFLKYFFLFYFSLYCYLK
jgi:hypothetical protein